ncbi:DNA glycosylase [Methanobrevibacter curvatus]|uniref:DNA-(apurinic or apyrimidinic site) lyase n=1 Tax=Methanobrevibacter curvatus TaxID=49547 RepID=A0A165YZ46_9EURY|nr:DNA glycosylase [Methanobrevibacter curvatus]KZX10051.1 DNA-3-methyladenine glycosylase [Methanobrevibacter curvatus]
MKIKSTISLQLTQKSGQTSQPPWKLLENSYCAVNLIDKNPILLKVSQNNIDSINVEYESLGCNIIDEKQINNKIAEIFDLNFNLKKFYKFLSNDEKLKPSVDFCNGLRLFLAKDIFECIVSSISSANNSIVRWTKSVDTIASKWGNGYNFDSGTFNSFPSPKILSTVYEDDIAENEGYSKKDNKKEILECKNNLKSCGVGYRAPYILKASEMFLSEINIYDIQDMNYEEAFDTIIKVPGVGPKVADCILLYGYGFKEAFPSDVWIKRIVSYLYFDGKDISVSKVREFGMEEFDKYAGYAQLYLFHFARKSGLMDKLSKK